MLLALVKKWLKRKLDIDLDLNLEYFQRVIQDGTLIAKVLESYKIITRNDVLLLEETVDPYIAQDNFLLIKTWLDSINLNLSQSDICDLVHGDGTIGITLFYELFEVLENKERDVIPVKHKRKHNFVLESFSEEKHDEIHFEENLLCEPLLKHWDIVNWERDRLKSIFLKYNQSRDEYYKYLVQKKEEKPITKVNDHELQIPESILTLENKTSNFTYEELILQQKAVMDMQQFEPNFDKAKTILNRIKKRNKKKTEQTALDLQFQYDLLHEVAIKIDQEEEAEFDRIICNDLLKQSLHEKEVAEKIMNVRKQKDIFINNIKIQNEIIQKKKEEKFIKDLLEEATENSLKFHQERMTKLAEHQQLYNEKLRLKALKHQKLCKEVVNDLVDIALVSTKYKNKYLAEPNCYEKIDWTHLFMKQQPVLNLLSSVESMAEDFEKEEIENSVSLQTQKVLDEQDFEDYINFAKFWSIQDILEKFSLSMKLGMNCLGYAVHKVLLKKYPLPVPQKPSFQQNFDTMVCISDLSVATQLTYLQRLLDFKSIKVITKNDVINFCINAFNDESKIEFDDLFPQEDQLVEITPKIRDNLKNEKKTKKSKKTKTSESKKTKSSKSKKNKKDKKPQEIKEPVVLLAEQTQTPKIFPEEKLLLTNKAILGKIAKSDLATESSISDKLFMEMFIEYLLSLNNCKGWVLANFPFIIEQTVLLEQYLTGKKLPNDNIKNFGNKESFLSMEIDGIRRSHVKTSSTSQSSSDQLLNDTEESLDMQASVPQTNPSNTDHKIIFPETETDSYSRLGTTTIEADQITSLSLPDLAIKSKDRAVNFLPDLAELAYADVSLDVNAKQSKSTNTKESEEKICNCIRAEENILQKEKSVQTVIIKPGETLIDANGQPIERVLAEDIYEKTRVSKIIPNTRPLEKENYCTPLTAYIKLEPKSETDDTFLLYDNKEKMNALEKFYSDQGCFYLLEYEELNIETIKCLAKMIIGDYSLPIKTSFELFGESYIQQMLEDGQHKTIKIAKKSKKTKEKDRKKKFDKVSTSAKTEKKSKKSKDSKSKNKTEKKSKQSKDSSKSKKITKKDKNKLEIIQKEFQDKIVQIPYVEEVEEEEIVEIKAGEPEWLYIDIDLPEYITHLLAELWINFETNYIENLKIMFSNNRAILKDIIIYLASVKKEMFKFIIREDKKQFYLREFQKILNGIDLNLRDDPKTKTQLYCQINEFQEKLFSICDSKMMESEKKRSDIIKEDWIFSRFREMSNSTVVNFQLEIDRFVDTLQFISNYYVGIIKKSIDNTCGFQKEVLSKINIDIDSNDFNTIFIDIETSNNSDSYFHQFVDNTKDICLQFIQKAEICAKKLIDDIKELKTSPKTSEKTSKKRKPKKFELSEVVQESWSTILEEWECAVRGEIARINLQLNVIKNESFTRFDNVILWIKNSFEQIYETIKERYKTEITSVKKASELLTRSVTEEMIIQPELTFEYNQLISIEVAIFTENEIKAENRPFTLQQIDYMISVLLDIAKSGFILKKTFLLFLQDVLYEDSLKEPRSWRNASVENLNLLLTKSFNDREYLYWKDFIIWMLLIPFPTREQLMFLRIQFRSIIDLESTEKIVFNDFQNIMYWFEKDGLDCKTIKLLIFKLYQISDNEINYSAMLLDFCKDENPLLGFVKALELSLGKYICYDKIKGEAFVNDVLENRLLYEKHEKLLRLAKRTVSLVVDQLQEKENVESILITELEDTNSLNINPNNKEFETNTFFSDQMFSTSQIGFEVRDDTAMAYFLPLKLILIVVKACIPFHLTTESITDDCFEDKVIKIYNECRNINFNNAVLAHEFLNHEKTVELFNSIKKFSAHSPVQMVKRVVFDFANPSEMVCFTNSSEVNNIV